MIRATFIRTQAGLRGFSISGHAGYDLYGRDIACASVTSAVQLTANGITEVLGAPAKIEIEENKIQLELPEGSYREAAGFLEALLLHLGILAQDFEGTICVNVSEVHSNA